MRQTLIVLNILAAILVLPAIQLAWGFHGINVMRKYTELQRAGCIDEEQMKKFATAHDLELGSNERKSVVEWLLSINTVKRLVGPPVMLGFLLNAFLLWREDRKCRTTDDGRKG